MKLGDVVRDKASGFEGTVIARCEYLDATPRLCIQPYCKEGGTSLPQSQWVDEPRTLLVEPAGELN